MPFAENEDYISKQLTELKREEEYSDYIDRIFELSGLVQTGRVKIISKHFQKHADYGLSERELEIAKLAALRMTVSEIANKLHLSEGTVRNHLSRVFSKVGVSGTKKNKRLELEKLFKGSGINN
jgi:LuxR family maltose regulon positive regulatory protein